MQTLIFSIVLAELQVKAGELEAAERALPSLIDAFTEQFGAEHDGTLRAWRALELLRQKQAEAAAAVSSHSEQQL